MIMTEPIGNQTKRRWWQIHLRGGTRYAARRVKTLLVVLMVLNLLIAPPASVPAVQMQTVTETVNPLADLFARSNDLTGFQNLSKVTELYNDLFAAGTAAAQTNNITFNLFVIDQNVVYGDEGTVNVIVTDIVTLVINDDDNLGFGESYSPFGTAQETNGPATIVSATSAIGTDYSGWVGRAFGTDTGWPGVIDGQTVQLYDGWVSTPAAIGSNTTLGFSGLGISAGYTYGRSFWFDVSTPPSSVPQPGDTISYTGQYNKDRPGEVLPAAALNNVAPTISQPATDPAAISIPENTVAITDVNTTDDSGIEGNGTLTYTLSGPDAALMIIDLATGVLSFNAAPDFENPASAVGSNVYSVTVTVADVGGLTDSVGVEVTVADVAENVAPVITSAAAVNAAENQTAVTTVTATDGNGDMLSYSISGGVDSAQFSIDSGTGVLTFVATPDFETPTDAGGNNVYDVQVTASDGNGGTDVQDIAVTVTDVAEGPEGIEYKLVYNSTSGLYEIWMRSTVTPGAPGTTGTAQVTIKAPHLMGTGIFSPTNITVQVADTAWAIGSRTDAPTADTSADYISFELDFPTNNNAAINWLGGQEILLFTFANGGVCAGPVTLMEDGDGFNAPPNNPGQQIDVFGLGVDPGNDFLGNYGLGQGDCDTDGDGIANGTDADDDGDGILDTVEGALTVDTDGDGIPNLIDADSDGDGLPDNIEAQRTSGYVAPSGSDTDNDGIDNAYDPDQGGSALTPVNTDGSDTPDYLDTDSDNAQGSDTTEAGLTKSNVDADKDGLDDGIDTNDTTFGPVNAGITTPATAYPDNDSDAGGSGDVDYRDGVDNSAVTIPVKLFLSGAYQGGGTMRTSLHRRPDFPLTSPYGDGATISNRAVLTTAQIVDWVLVEVRPVGALSNTVVISVAGVLQSDGDLVSVDGTTPITVAVTQGNYYVAVRHRNHLGAMTAAPVALSDSTVLINFTTLGSNATYGTNGQRWLNGIYGLHSGDVSGNGQVIGAGPGNDLTNVRSTVLAAPGNVNHNRNYIVYAYHQADINLDGQVILAGPGNDVEPLFDSILSHPSNSGANAAYIIYQQLPQ